MRTSRRFKTLINRLRAIELHFLPNRFSLIGKYNPREHDLARGFVLLAHAEIESYFEDRAGEIVQKAEGRWRKRGVHSAVIRRLVVAHNSRNRQPWKPFDKSPDRIEAALNSYKSSIQNNHGIKETNICVLFFPLGIEYRQLDVNWLLTLESFGESRGLLAHSSIKTQQPIDPESESKKVAEIIKGLKSLDRKISRLIN